VTSHRNEDGTFFAWDSTMLKAAEKCPRYFYYKHIEGWESGMKSHHLTFGGFYASAIERYHKARATGASHDEALNATVWQTLKDTWEITGTKDGEPIGRPWNSYDNNKNRETLIRSIVWYLETILEDGSETIILSDGKPAVEYSFKLEVDNGLIFCGHIDRLARIMGDIYVTDQKTTGSTITPRFFDGFNPDTQMSMYTFAGKAIWDLPVKGVVIDGAQIAVGFTRFERGFSFRTDAQLDEWYDQVMELITRVNGYVRQMMEHPEGSGSFSPEQAFPMNPSSCGNYGGCEFRHICSMDPATRKKFLPAGFKQGWTWNPLIPR
jgi:hypothetical protein